MQKKIFLTLLLPLLIIISVTPFAFGQLTNESIIVTTDSVFYSEGELIIISGEVRDLYSGTPVSVMVTSIFDSNGDGDNDLISISQVEVAADKKFSNVLTAGGALMKYGGTYTVTVQYGTMNRSATTSFYFDGEILEPIQTSIAVQANKLSYGTGDIISISGSIKTLAEYAQSVTVLVVDPLGNIVTIAQVIPSSDGNFSTSLEAGVGMLYDGDYEIRAQYGSQKITNTFVFTDDGFVTPEPIPESLCGAGSYYDIDKNSCVLDTVVIPEFDPIESQIDDIPLWVKGVFQFWVDGQIDDNELKEAIKFLVNTGIIIL